MSPVREDLRYALRRLIARPLFTFAAVSILAIGLTSSAAVFTYLNNFGRPFPGADAEGLARVYLSTDDQPYRALSWPDYLDLTRADGVVTGVAGTVSGFAASVRLEALAEVAFGEAVTGDYFRLLQVRIPVGRALTPADDTPGAEPAVVLSHAYWLSRYEGNPSAIGQTILLNSEPYTIVGIAPPDFLGSRSDGRPDFFLPFSQYRRVYWARSSLEEDRESAVVSVLVRLTGSREAGADALAGLATALDAEYRLETGPRRFRVESATWIEPTARQAELPTVRLWFAAAAGLLLLACANVANLVLAVSTRRGPEMALRAALGASSGRLLRQLLTESVVLAGVAGAVAVALAGPMSRRIGSWFARPSVWGSNVPREIAVDAHVLLFVVAASVLTGVLAGIVPAWRGSHGDLGAALRDEGRSGTGGAPSVGWRSFGVREALVSSQIALSLVLLVVAGLVLRTLDAARGAEAGFDTETTIATYVSTSSVGTPVDERHRFYDDLVQQFEAMPWVRAATVSDFAPLSPHSGIVVRPDGWDETLPVRHSKVAAGYFEALGIEVEAGRTFTLADSAGAEPVAIVGEALARRAFGTEGAIGRQLWWPVEEGSGAGGGEDAPDTEHPLRVVGVVADARLETLLGDPELVVYLPLAQHYSAPGNSLLVSVEGDPVQGAIQVEQGLRAVNPMIAIVNVLPYRDVVGGYLYEQRMNAELFTLVALLGSALACGGIFAIMSLVVGLRRRELGIRVALGASKIEVVRAVAHRVLLATGVGLLLGLVGAVVAGRAAAGLLYAVAPTDLASFVAGALALAGAALLAALVPTRRALRLDPMESLRGD